MEFVLIENVSGTILDECKKHNVTYKFTYDPTAWRGYDVILEYEPNQSNLIRSMLENIPESDIHYGIDTFPTIYKKGKIIEWRKMDW